MVFRLFLEIVHILHTICWYSMYRIVDHSLSPPHKNETPRENGGFRTFMRHRMYEYCSKNKIVHFFVEK